MSEKRKTVRRSSIRRQRRRFFRKVFIAWCAFVVLIAVVLDIIFVVSCSAYGIEPIGATDMPFIFLACVGGLVLVTIPPMFFTMMTYTFATSEQVKQTTDSLLDFRDSLVFRRRYTKRKNEPYHTIHEDGELVELNFEDEKQKPDG